MVLYRLFVLITFDLKSDESQGRTSQVSMGGRGRLRAERTQTGGISQDLEDQGAGA